MDVKFHTTVASRTLPLHAINHRNVTVKMSSQISITVLSAPRKRQPVTCATCPLVSPNMRSVLGVNLAVFRGRDIQAAVLLDCNLKGEARDGESKKTSFYKFLIPAAACLS